MSPKLHLGCGTRYFEGYVNCDISPEVKTDACFDADDPKVPWPFPDDYFDTMVCHHALEHYRNYLWVMSEVWRVCQTGALLHITVPYITNSEYNAVNPYHHTHFNEHSFKFFDPELLRGSANEYLYPTTLRTIKVDYTYFPEWAGKVNKDYARKHYWNVVKEISFEIEVLKEL